MKEVVKRDGRKDNFDATKIFRAISKANKSLEENKRMSEEAINEVVELVLFDLGNNESIDIEVIQDAIEKELMNGYCDVAKAFILYREERAKERFKKLEITKAIKEKLDAAKIVNSNANMDEASFGGRKGEASNELVKEMALNFYMSPKMAKNHRDNRIYIHDLDSYAIGQHNCAEEKTWIKVVIDGEPKNIQLKALGEMLEAENGTEIDVSKCNISILSRDGYTSLNKIWKRETDNQEKLYTIKTRTGIPLKFTGEHKLPVIRDEKEHLLKVKDLKIGDKLISTSIPMSAEDLRDSGLSLIDLTESKFDLDLRKGISSKFSSTEIINITTDEEKHIVYDLETGDHWFVANGIVVHNCLSCPVDDLLEKGFNTRQTDIRPASSINTAFQLLAVIFQIQSLQQLGGVSATHIDWTMVPYVRLSFYKHYKEVADILNIKIKELDKETIKRTSIETFKSRFGKNKKLYDNALKLTLKELNQSVEGMYHNLNTLQSRSGNQLPFSSLNYGTCTLVEGRMVIKALLDGSLKGTGKFGRLAIFPCGIFQKMKGVNDEGSPNI